MHTSALDEKKEKNAFNEPWPHGQAHLTWTAHLVKVPVAAAEQPLECSIGREDRPPVGAAAAVGPAAVPGAAVLLPLPPLPLLFIFLVLLLIIIIFIGEVVLVLIGVRTQV